MSNDMPVGRITQLTNTPTKMKDIVIETASDAAARRLRAFAEWVLSDKFDSRELNARAAQALGRP